MIHNVWLRQIALDIERQLKIAILNQMPVRRSDFYHSRYERWKENKLGQVRVDELWDEAAEKSMQRFCNSVERIGRKK
jgi:hypothetical protein